MNVERPTSNVQRRSKETKSSNVGRWRFNVGCSTFFLFLLLIQVANAGVKNLESTRPRCGQRGTTVDVEIQGVCLDDPREIIFFKPGIRAYDFKMKDEQPRHRNMAHGAFIDAAITCKFEISADCVPGEYPFRLLTATQLTQIGTFHVSPFLTIEESAEPNNTLDEAIVVQPNVTVNGLLDNDLRDYYRVPVKAGQQLSVELNSVRISDVHYGTSYYDLDVRILNGEGREIASNDDNALHLQDPVVTTMIDYDGHAFVVVKRSVEQPYKTEYVLHIGTFHRPMISFPLGAQSGTEQSFRMIGNASGDFETTLKVPAQRGSFEYFGDAPSSLKLRSSPFPNVVEDAASAETVVPLSSSSNIDEPPGLRVALNGIIEDRDDIDTFRLTVRQDESLHVRVFAAMLGSSIDARITIRPISKDGSPGEPEVEAEDAKLTDRDVFGVHYNSGGGRPEILDPSIIWTPQTDGEYLLEISDSSDAGGPRGIYRVEIEPPRTVVQTVLRSQTYYWTESTRFTGLAVPQGGRWAINVSLPTGQWTPLKGEFDLVARGLPQGVRLVSPRVPSGISSGLRFWPVQLVAAANAEIGGAIITFEAKPVDTSQKVESRTQQNVPFLNHPGGDSLHYVQVDRHIMAVTEPVPFTIDIEQPRTALVRGGELAIPVTISRRDGFEGPVEYWVKTGDRTITSQPATTIEPGETESILRMAADASAPLGPLPLVVLGRSMENAIPRSLGAGDLRASSKIVQLTIAEPYVELISQPSSIRRGETKPFTFTAQHKAPLEGNARVRLLGLPKGVTTDSAPILKSDTKQIVFDLTATDEALLGQVTDLNCEITVTIGDQEVMQRTGRGVLRIDPRKQ